MVLGYASLSQACGVWLVMVLGGLAQVGSQRCAPQCSRGPTLRVGPVAYFLLRVRVAACDFGARLSWLLESVSVCRCASPRPGVRLAGAMWGHPGVRFRSCSGHAWRTCFLGEGRVRAWGATGGGRRGEWYPVLQLASLPCPARFPPKLKAKCRLSWRPCPFPLRVADAGSLWRALSLFGSRCMACVRLIVLV